MKLERKPLKVSRGLSRPAETLLYQGLEGVHRFGLAVNETHTTRLGWKRAEPSQNFTAVGVCRHRVDLRNPRVHGNRLSVNPDVARAVDELTAARTGGLIADEQDRVARVRK